MKIQNDPPPSNWNSLWPAIKGSLAKVYKPCIRPHCPQCLAGTKHPAHILSFTQKGKRKCMYVPQELVPAIQRAIDNGRKIEGLLYAQGPQILKKYRATRDNPNNQKQPKKPRKSKKSAPKS
jgi:hypothetical protein